jgi:hypothetical protein
MIERFSQTLSVLAVLIAIVASLAGCQRDLLFTPEYTELEPAPMETDLTQLYDDYISNIQTADSKYLDKSLVFYDVLVEEVIGDVYADMEFEMRYQKDYFISGSVRFYLKDYLLMQSIEEGYILNIVGKCDGYRYGEIRIIDCWVGGVEGELIDVPNWEY